MAPQQKEKITCGVSIKNTKQPQQLKGDGNTCSHYLEIELLSSQYATQMRHDSTTSPQETDQIPLKF